jgi:hypothetical protein
MKLLVKGLGLIVGSVLASAAYAAVDGSEAVICAVAEITECVPDEACQRVKAREAGIPRFLRIDFAGKRITRTKPSGEDITSQIKRREVVDGRVILQGAEDGVEGVRDGIGWSLSIDEASGDMVLTGSGADVAFVIFGACTAL